MATSSRSSSRGPSWRRGTLSRVVVVAFALTAWSSTGRAQAPPPPLPRGFVLVDPGAPPARPLGAERPRPARTESALPVPRLRLRDTSPARRSAFPLTVRADLRAARRHMLTGSTLILVGLVTTMGTIAAIAAERPACADGDFTFCWDFRSQAAMAAAALLSPVWISGVVLQSRGRRRLVHAQRQLGLALGTSGAGLMLHVRF